MSVSENFKIFCCNLKMPESTVQTIQNRYHQITKRINSDYHNIDSDIKNSLYVGSYGRDTEIFTSDIDILVRLPYSIYDRFNSYTNNGQSYLLQHVKGVLDKTYSTSDKKGDGQVIGIDFKDGISFEILPSFLNTDGTYTHPDSNNGGSWKTTDPKSEINAINELNKETNKNLKRLCRMARAWKDTCNVPMSGILIDTLAYKFLKDWEYKNKSYIFYDWMSRDFFKFLKDLDKNQSYWFRPGSNRKISKTGNFQTKASQAYTKSLEAIEHYNKGNKYTSKQKWREIYGSKFPK